MSLKSLISSKASAALQSGRAFLLVAPGLSRSVRDCGIDFRFQFYDMDLVERLSKSAKSASRASGDPLLPPFDDALHVCDIGGPYGHHVLVNKFMQRIGHVVLSSRDRSAVQGDALAAGDFAALGRLLREYSGSGIAYYNAGRNSGASQRHKHMQFMPGVSGGVLRAMGDGADLPFVYHALRLRSMEAHEIECAYGELRSMAVHDREHDSYNFIVSDNVACYVPRLRSLSRSRVMINSVSMAGILTIWEWNQPKNPMKLLSDVTIPKAA